MQLNARALAALLLLALPLQAKTFRVHAGDDASPSRVELEDGTVVVSPHPIAEALRRTSPDEWDTLILGPGTFGPFTVGWKNTGPNAALAEGICKVRIVGHGPDSTRIVSAPDAAGNPGPIVTIALWNIVGRQSELGFYGLEVVGGQRYGLEVAQYQGGVPGLVVEDCRFLGAPDYPHTLSGIRTYESVLAVRRTHFANFREHGAYRSSIPAADFPDFEDGLFECTFDNCGRTATQTVDRIVDAPDVDGSGTTYVQGCTITNCGKGAPINSGPLQYAGGGSCITVAGHKGHVAILYNTVRGSKTGALVLWGDSGKGDPPFIGSAFVHGNRFDVDNPDRDLCAVSSVVVLHWGRNWLSANGRALLHFDPPNAGPPVGQMPDFWMGASDPRWGLRGQAVKAKRNRVELTDAELDALVSHR